MGKQSMQGRKEAAPGREVRKKEAKSETRN
jgi:hypothetical protein